MTMPSPDAAFNGLTERVDGLPADWYYDTGQYRRELDKIWYRNWIYVARSSEIGAARSVRRVAVGDQQLLLVRDDEGVLRGFHNTCRHRGAALCRESSGQLRSGAIVCPYHAWVYSLEGELLRTSSKSRPAGFDMRDFHLYRIRVLEWSGFVFVALCDAVPPLAQSFDQPIDRMNAWGLAGLAVGHVFTKIIECNWKIFWENYNECLHCPGVHPELSQLVPIFGRALLEERDDPNWREHLGDDDPKFKGGLRAGALTWSRDGQASGALFPGLSDADRKAGHIYMTSLPSMFIVGHVDYVRVVRLLPLGAERTELRVEYLFAPESLESPEFDLGNIVEFTNLVMSEDAEVCELNQQGLRALPHARGVVMPEEYVIKQLHDWIKAELQRV
jgi:Rieske 2Fe-2S family protein